MVRIKGEIKGLDTPVLALTVFNGVQGWFHDGYVNAKEARLLADELNKWADAVDARLEAK